MKKLVSWALIMALLSLFLVACSPTEAPSGAKVECPIKVGIITSQSGSHAKFGEAQMRGYELAVEEINAAGGILGCEVELVVEDDASEAANAQVAVEKLATEVNVPIIVGAYSSAATFPASGVAEEYEVPFLVPTAATDSITAQGYKWVFRICAPSAVYAGTVLDFAEAVGKPATLAIIYENTTFGSSTAEAAQADAETRGIQIVAYEAYEAGSPDYKPTLTRVKDANPDAIFFVSYLADATLLMRQCEELDLNPKLYLAGGAGFSLPEFPEQAGENAEYTTSVTQWTPDVDWPGAAQFTQKFTDKYGLAPQYHSAETYAALYVVKDALERAGSLDRTAIRDALKATDTNTIFGPIKFDEKGQNTHPMLVTQVLQGEFVTVFPLEYKAQDAVVPVPSWSDR